MSKTTIFIKRRRQRGRSFADEVSMMLEASEFLNIVRDKKNKTGLQRFNKLVSLVLGADHAKDLNKLRKYLSDQNALQLEDTELDSAASLRLRPSFEEPIQRAFAKAKLNPDDQIYGRILLMLLCWSVFPPENSAGRGPVWTGQKYCQLLRDEYKLEYATRKRSRSEISRELKGYSQSGGTLEKQLKRARDPEYNSVLKFHVGRGLSFIREGYEERDCEWPPVDLEFVEQRISKLTQAESISSVAKPHIVFDSLSALEMFNTARASSHARLLQVIQASELETRELEVFLESRRAKKDSAIHRGFSAAVEYGTVLRALERAIKNDICELRRSTYIDEAALAVAYAEKQRRELARLEFCHSDILL